MIKAPLQTFSLVLLILPSRALPRTQSTSCSVFTLLCSLVLCLSGVHQFFLDTFVSIFSAGKTLCSTMDRERVHVSEVSSDHSEFRFHPWIHAVIWNSNFYKSGYLQLCKHSDDGSNGEPHQGASGIGPKESCIGEHLRQ